LYAELLISALIVDPVVERSLVVATSMKRANRAGVVALLHIIKGQIKELDAETGWSVLRPPTGPPTNSKR